MKSFKNFFIFLLIVCVGIGTWRLYWTFVHEREVLNKIIERLNADSRAAEVLVTNVNYDEATRKTYTTIKFLEYDTLGRPLESKYFTFSGNIIQFQSLVVRYDDVLVGRGDALKGKSAYLFWKVFMLDGKDTQVYDLSLVNTVPGGYKLSTVTDPYEEKLWRNFWDYALNARLAKKAGIKNAQIEAPGTIFIPGYLYTLKIEHDGGIRIDAKILPEILKGEKISP